MKPSKLIRCVKVVAFPTFFTILLISVYYYWLHLIAGADLVASYQFNKPFGILMLIILFLSAGDAIHSGVDIRGTLGNFLATWNSLVAIAAIIITVIVMAGSNAPSEALSSQISPLVHRLFEDPPKALIKGELSLDSLGNPSFLAQSEDNMPSWRTTSAVDVLLLEASMEGRTSGVLKSIVVVGRSWYSTGRSVALDIGTAPEYRQQVFLYVVDVPTWQIIWVEGPLIGGEAHLPFMRAPGGGIVTLEKMYGPEVTDREIDIAASEIAWK
jgi:hypothetical protein